MAINWAQVLQLVSLLAATHSSGYGLCSDRVAVHNALLLSDRDTVTRQWFRAWDFGRKYGPFVVTGSGLGFLGAALLDGISSPAFGFNVAASLSMGLVVVYTVFIVFPVNDKLLEAHANLTDHKKSDDDSQTTEDIRSLTAAWKTADLKRTLLSTFAALAGLVAACK
ncbi:hypothetical protein CDV36_000428 [Fusarium kuroshium]|uniref:DUF1772 domain-containing protein n=2 Tax=Fusarium solani species complex TaxID=232080 RepID=A0A3M2SQS1_9HYPO|nr:hypothetical protein CDV36_000428 [Fusarium kuroshium]RSM14780.1 hypothetical protein CDV31_005214 [Fusarium ambrosium]